MPDSLRKRLAAAGPWIPGRTGSLARVLFAAGLGAWVGAVGMMLILGNSMADHPSDRVDFGAAVAVAVFAFGMPIAAFVLMAVNEIVVWRRRRRRHA